jgi:site-specific recombinase XerD
VALIRKACFGSTPDFLTLSEYRAAMIEKDLSPSTVNVRQSAIRKLIGEARRNGILDAEQAAQMADVPNVRQQGTRMGNWLTREQAKELLAVPDRPSLKGKRDAVILPCSSAAPCAAASWRSSRSAISSNARAVGCYSTW